MTDINFEHGLNVTREDKWLTVDVDEGDLDGTEISGGDGSGRSKEEIQDFVGEAFGDGLIYDDATPEYLIDEAYAATWTTQQTFNAGINLAGSDLVDVNIIEDGSSVARLDIDPNYTRINSEHGDPTFEANGGLYARIYAHNDEPLVIRDDQGDFDAVTYTTAASEPGTLELGGATLDMSENDIINVRTSGDSPVVSGTDYEIQKDGTDGSGVINFKTS